MGWSSVDIKERFQWTFPIVFSPQDPNTLFVSSQHLFRTRDEGQSPVAVLRRWLHLLAEDHVLRLRLRNAQHRLEPARLRHARQHLPRHHPLPELEREMEEYRRVAQAIDLILRPT